MPLELDLQQADFAAAFEAFLVHGRDQEHSVRGVVEAILADVAAHGDAAVIDYTQRFDRLSLTPETMRFGADEIAAARAACDRETLAALEMAAARIRAFHEIQKPKDHHHRDAEGVELGYRWTAIEAAGLYVPGGRASYPSSVLMNAIPAKVAGVDRLVMVVPSPDGLINPLVLAAAALAGVDEIYRIGGAQAVAALAYGTAVIAPVDKIVGPGNAYVAEAKRQVFGRVGIDTIAGPSEILVVADGANDPAFIAADLLSQAEHDSAAQSILITDDKAFADAVKAAIAGHLETLPRAAIASQSWADHGAVIVVGDLMADAPALVNRLAPEHLELAVDDPHGMAGKIRHAGAIFLGRYTPEAIGDYVAGPNHVLPTSRAARFSSGLSVLDFMKRTTLVGCDAQSLARIGPAAALLARAEGLGAHERSVLIRLETKAENPA
ncbi:MULTISPECIES: histidinol dehydrogenase [unclassified Iodidimonas]|jgi:histidinol dehydrogenase|uniref:histidinol dehydrogenase n=1 Tax=unclassified Iodidimonas TaxID=2626145 RepID=UPI002482B292|nr:MULTISPECIES: histidinol dehydrogenase [unclassified Iodidimonas]